tara:strand:+ start:631 stop:930 length:300 start_codon:yes stop_codon:yes gene_type:complete
MFNVVLFNQDTGDVLQKVHCFKERDDAIMHACTLIQVMGCSSYYIKNIEFNGSSLLVYSTMPIAVICEGINMVGAEKGGPFLNNFFEKKQSVVITSIEA